MFHVSVSCFHNTYRRATLFSLYSLLAKISIGNDNFFPNFLYTFGRRKSSESKVTYNCRSDGPNICLLFQTCVPAILPPLKYIYPGNMADDLKGTFYLLFEHEMKCHYSRNWDIEVSYVEAKPIHRKLYYSLSLVILSFCSPSWLCYFVYTAWGIS